jgi:glycosyltransferase involved in cell wall biosynthesis
MNESTTEPRVLLLDLSGNERVAREWAIHYFRTPQVQSLNKADLKWSSKRQALAEARKFKPRAFAIFTRDIALQSTRCSMILFGAFAGARCIVLGDSKGRAIKRSRLSAFALEAPRLFFELLFGYGFLVPLSWLLTLLLGFGLRFRSLVRHINAHSPKAESSRQSNLANVESFGEEEIPPSPLLPHSPTPLLPYSLTPSLPSSQRLRAAAPQTVLYIRATLTSAKEGGMVTHVAGFTNGAQALGHRLQFLISGDPATEPSNEGARVDNLRHTISPSASISATRAIFELWNNLRFTARSLNWLQDEASRGFDFLYQRYSRFNWTGVALSVLTGLPLALEFNGSEVWVSQRWDPVGQLALLKRFERLNQRAADFIFTVSEVERRNLIKAGVSAKKVFVNPNGVDTDKFRAGCGGLEIRKQLGIEQKIVIGFLGTFGPWHGAPVLAEAATRVRLPCHFLFLGDGDERAVSEAIFATTKDRATFTGRIPHDRVAAYLDACDILVAPHVPAKDGSEFFGSPTKLFEYLAMARPVIASRLGQIADVVLDGENGLLVEPGDADHLARAIERLASDKALRSRLSAAARQTVMQQYTWRHNAARVFDTVKASEMNCPLQAARASQ